jgi:putative hydrolase of the HAD superfamily
MAGAEVLLFDFFGTLVAYSDSRREQGYRRSHELLGSWGCDLAYDAFLDRWESVSETLEAEALETRVEYSMRQVSAAFLEGVLDLSGVEHDALGALYGEEWCVGVRAIEGLPAMLAGLARHHRIGVVTNTHSDPLVPQLLDRFGLAPYVEVVVTSIGVGLRKPHPKIFQVALDAFGADPSEVLFVGDSLVPDYEGPRAAGMQALLIDPAALHPVPDEHRLRTILDLGPHLSHSGA